jgi:hypothetical protein
MRSSDGAVESFHGRLLGRGKAYGEGGGGGLSFFQGPMAPLLRVGAVGWVVSVCDLEGRDRIVEQCWRWVFAAALAMTSTVALMMLMLMLYEVVAVKFTFPRLSTFHPPMAAAIARGG